jgi:hypothetical protein
MNTVSKLDTIKIEKALEIFKQLEDLKIGIAHDEINYNYSLALDLEQRINEIIEKLDQVIEIIATPTNKETK